MFGTHAIKISLDWVITIVLSMITGMAIFWLISVENQRLNLSAKIQVLESENADLRLTVLDLTDTLKKQERLIQKRTKP